jgi:hypothetical protein
LRVTIHGNDAAEKPGGVHTITAAAERRDARRAGRWFSKRRSRLSDHALGGRPEKSVMMNRSAIAGVTILLAWMLIDALTHRLVLTPYYEASPALWRPLDQMNSALISAITLLLVGVFVGIYQVLVRPKSLGAGLMLGTLLGLALGISSGFGTFIHMPIPLPLAWGWFTAGSLKGFVAGGLLGTIIRNAPDP